MHFLKLIQNNTPKWDWNPIFSSTNLYISQKKKKKKKKKTGNEFVEKITMINEIFKKQMVFVLNSYEDYANKHKKPFQITL